MQGSQTTSQPATREARAAAAQERREVARVLDRIYERTDIQPKPPWRFLAGVVLVWALATALNYLVFSAPLKSTSKQAEKERLQLCVGYGPLFQPLQIAQLERRGGKLFDKLEPRKVALLPLALVASLLGAVSYPALFDAERSSRKRKAQQHAKQQGRYPLGDVAHKLRLKHGQGIPLGQLRGEVVGVPYASDAGHVIVLAPSRRGKGLHLTETLFAWPGAAVVLDPKLVHGKHEQFERSAGHRGGLGLIYKVGPTSPHSIDLLDYYNPHDPLDLQELFSHLLRPWAEKEPIFVEKCLALFEAARDVAAATQGHMLAILAAWTQQPAREALAAAAKHAPGPVAKFTGVAFEPDEHGSYPELSRFAASAWESFTTRYGPFVPHIKTVTQSTIPATWAEQQATIFLCYPLDQLAIAGALVSAIVAGLIKGRMRQAQKQYVLFALDEMPTVALGNLDTYLATVGGYGVTILAYAQSLPQIETIYGRAKAQAIMSNFHHQVFYTPQENASAAYISEAFGTQLVFTMSVSKAGFGANAKHTATVSEHYELALAPQDVASLPLFLTVVFTERQRRKYTLLTQALNPYHHRDSFPPPPPLIVARPLQARPLAELAALTSTAPTSVPAAEQADNQRTAEALPPSQASTSPVAPPQPLDGGSPF